LAPQPGLASDEDRRYFAVAAPGLEVVVVNELKDLGLGGVGSPGGASFGGDRAALYRANLHLRSASRVLVRLGGFHAAAFSELRKKGGRLPWEAYLRPGQPVAIHATSHKSKLYHSGAVAERVAGAIADRLGQPAAVKTADAETDAFAADKASAGAAPAGPQLIVVRLVRDQCTLSFDASGLLLHRRGYRLATAKAPLRETLAAGMLLASGWDRVTPLVDPFCGAGTIAIEAALLALNIAPGHARHFAFMDWPDYDAQLWQRLLAAAAAGVIGSPRPLIIGSDRDAGAIEAARANAARAGVAEVIDFAQRPVSDLAPPVVSGRTRLGPAALGAAEAGPAEAGPTEAGPAGRGWVVTNPPYGVRLSEGHDLRNLYARFGQVLKRRFPGWRVAFLSSDTRLEHAMGLEFDELHRLPLANGAVRVHLAQARVPAGPIDV
jgi:putative N6-adenine-specific DNA methylase